ncbi:hypothetical protein CPB86DRAFT_871052 [Serendipita vermifera]|nr:hypothetical protein CPB86DRAFT_871052 [Serendipita vermifera]
MAETESTQTWVSTGRGGAGNFPYTPRALAKRPVTLTAPQGREVDYRRQSIARSGRNGMGFWAPEPDETAKQVEAQEFEKDQKVIRESVERRLSVMVGGAGVVKSGRGGAGNISSPVDQEPRLPVTRDEGDELTRVHSYGRGGANYRFGDAIPMVDMNRTENAERVEAKARLSSSPPPNTESGFASIAGHVSAFLAALTPVENRIENMSPISSSTSPTSTRRTSVNTAGGRGGAGNYGYATYKSSSAKSSPISPSTSSRIPEEASSSSSQHRKDSVYRVEEYEHGYDPEMPVASTSSASTSRAGTSSFSNASAY